MRFILHAMAMVGFAFVHMTPLQAAPLAPYHILDQFNLITFSDMNAHSDVEGRTLIGGNLKGASATFFTRPQQAAPSDYAAFTVGGNVSGGYKNINGGGDAMIAGNVQNLNMNGGIAYIGQSITGNVNGNKVTGASVVVPDFKPILSDLSDGLAGLDANSSVITTGGKATFNAAPDSHGVAIFTIADGKSFFNSINEIDFILNSADSIIINVFGTEMTVAENFLGGIGTTIAPLTLWNFHDATSLNFNTAFYGSVLATGAAVKNMNELHGSMIFDSFDQHGAVRLASFSGNLPSFGPGGSGYAAVMAPASGGLFAFAYLICLALRRRFF